MFNSFGKGGAGEVYRVESVEILLGMLDSELENTIPDLLEIVPEYLAVS